MGETELSLPEIGTSLPLLDLYEGAPLLPPDFGSAEAG
jgi:hypothetical protein